MKDKVEQRERTEMIVGGARTFNEFVKERASSNNLTPACVRSLPEIKAEWQQLKAKQLAVKKAEKAKTVEARKAEKRATAEAKKAEKRATKAVVKEKTVIKKVAKKASADAENIKLVLVEKAKASVPPAEPKNKGRPKKYATPEEARRAKIEATKVLNKAKKAQQPPKPPKQPKAKKPKKKSALKELEEFAEGDETEQMGMEDEDVPTYIASDVANAERELFKAKTHQDLDKVLFYIKRVIPREIYTKLDKYNKKSLDHTIEVYTRKRDALFKIAKDKDLADRELAKKARIKAQEAEAFQTALRQAPANLATWRRAKETAPQRKRESAERDTMGSEDINRARKVNKPPVLKRKNIAKMVKDTGFEGRGFNPDDLKEFKNYGKIQDHLAQHLNDLKEKMDAKDVRDYIYFTKEKARLKTKLTGGRMIGGDFDMIDQILTDPNITDEMLWELERFFRETPDNPVSAPHLRDRVLGEIARRTQIQQAEYDRIHKAPKVTGRKRFGKGYGSDSDSDMEGGWSFSGRDYNPLTLAYNALLNGVTENYRNDITPAGVKQDIDRNIKDAKSFGKNPNPEAFAFGMAKDQASRYEG